MTPGTSVFVGFPAIFAALAANRAAEEQDPVRRQRILYLALGALSFSVLAGIVQKV